MASHRLLIKPSAGKGLEALPRTERRRLVVRTDQPALDPRPPGSEMLPSGEKYRVRQGNYRVVYAIDDADPYVVVVPIAHRRDLYR